MSFTDQEIRNKATQLEKAGAPPSDIEEFVRRSKSEQTPVQAKSEPFFNTKDFGSRFLQNLGVGAKKVLIENPQSLVRPFAKATIGGGSALAQKVTGVDYSALAGPSSLPGILLGGDLRSKGPLDYAGSVAESALNLSGAGAVSGQAAKVALPSALNLIKQGAKYGAGYGAAQTAQEQNPEDNVVSKTLNIAGGAVKGAALGAPLGYLGGKVASKISGIEQPKVNFKETTAKAGADIISSTQKLDPTQSVKFKKMTGKTPGEWLQERGVIDTRENTISNLVDYWKKAKATVDNATSKIEGRFYDKSAEKILVDLADYYKKTADRGGMGLTKRRLETLKKEGLSISELNAIKRDYEANVKTGYLKENNTTGVQRATNMDTAIRNFIAEKARERGFTNLPEINKETQAARFLADAIWRKLNKQNANNLFSLTDNLLLVGGAINPGSLAALSLKKILSSESVKSYAARKLSPSPTRGIPEAPTQRIELKSRQLKY